jgi:FKBP-type peptidyl-prolyl cis-trans isomerase
MKRAALVIGVVGLGLTGCEGSKTPKSDQEKYSYSIGYQFAKNLKQQNVTFDVASVKQAVADVAAGKDSQVDEQETQKVMQKMYEERSKKMKEEADTNKKKSDEWLAANKSKPDIKVTPSGLQYKVEREGEGAKPKDSEIVVVQYKGTLTDGTEFDSSYKRNQPAEFPLKAVIPGWTEGLQLMSKGAKYHFYIPPELAYGERGRPSIPANSALIFEVELVDIKAAPAAPMPPKGAPKAAAAKVKKGSGK